MLKTRHNYVQQGTIYVSINDKNQVYLRKKMKNRQEIMICK